MVTDRTNDLTRSLLSCHLKILEKSNSQCSDLIDSYASLARHFSEDCSSVEMVFPSFQDGFSKCVIRDLQGDSHLVQGAIHFLGQLLKQKNAYDFLSKEWIEIVFDGIIQILSSTEDKGICWKALVFFGMPELPSTIMKNKIKPILTAVERILMSKLFGTPLLEKESLKVIANLLKHCHAEMENYLELWIKYIYPFIASATSEVGDIALKIIMDELPMLTKHREIVMQYLEPDLSTGLLDALKNKLQKSDAKFVLNAWSCFVTILGQAMHKGGSLTNDMLKVTEKCFKSTLPEVQSLAFRAWKSLISNYATSASLCSTQKRLKLLMMPLMYPLSKTRREEVELSRFDAWWHMICQLGPSINSCFSDVVLPFLQFCFKLQDGSTGPLDGCSTPERLSNAERNLKDILQSPSVVLMFSQRTPKSEKLKQTKLHVPFNAITQKGAEALLQLLGGTLPNEVQCSIGTYSGGRIKSEHFRTNCHCIFSAVQEVLGSVSLKESLLMSTWIALIQTLRVVLTEEKSEANNACIGGLILLMQKISEDKTVGSSLFLVMLGYCFHHLRDATMPYREVLKTDENPHGLLAIILLSMLSSKRLLQEGCYHKDRFHSFWDEMVLSTLSGAANQLQYLQTLLTFIQKICILHKNSDLLWQVWSVVAERLIQYIVRTNDVNQGDALTHDYGCVASVLMLPLKYLYSDEFPDATIKELNKTWLQLFNAFKIAADLVPSAGANSAVIEFCNKVLVLLEDKKEAKYKTCIFISRLLDIMLGVVKGIDFKYVAKQQLLISPGKLARRFGQFKENDVSVFRVASLILESAMNDVDQRNHNAVMLSSLQLVDSIIACTMTSEYTRSFIAEISPTIIKALENESVQSEKRNIFQAVDQKRMQSTKISKRICGVLDHLYRKIEKNCKDSFDNELLAVTTDLLECTLKAEKKELKKTAIRFWNATFGQSKEALRLSLSLKQLLSSMPNAVTMPGINLDEELTQFPDHENNPEITGSPKLNTSTVAAHQSPHRIRGSFLNLLTDADNKKLTSTSKALFSSPTKSPLKTGIPSPRKERKKLVWLEDASSSEFVKIESPPKTTRLLTEHQKEVMRSRRIIPALYNNLDQSQDSNIFSLMTQENSQKSQSDSLMNGNTLNVEFQNHSKGPVKEIEKSCDLTNKDIGNQGISSDFSRSDTHEDVKPVGLTNGTDVSPNNDKKQLHQRVVVSPSLPKPVLFVDDTKPVPIATRDVEKSNYQADNSPEIIPSTQSQEDSPSGEDDVVLYDTGMKNGADRETHKSLIQPVAEEVGRQEGNMEEVAQDTLSVKWDKVLVEETQTYSMDMEDVDRDGKDLIVEDSEKPHSPSKELNDEGGKVATEAAEAVGSEQGTTSGSSTKNGVVDGQQDEDVVEIDTSPNTSPVTSPVSTRLRKKTEPGKPRTRQSTKSKPAKKITSEDRGDKENAKKGRQRRVTFSSLPNKKQTENNAESSDSQSQELETGGKTSGPPERTPKTRRRRSTPYQKRRRSRLSAPIDFETTPTIYEEEGNRGEENEIQSREEKDKVKNNKNGDKSVGVEGKEEEQISMNQEKEDNIQKSDLPRECQTGDVPVNGNSPGCTTISAPAIRNFNSKTLDSPGVSPVNGILKKRIGGKVESPSPPNKIRRVSFALPLERSSLAATEDENELARPLGDTEYTERTGKSTRIYTNIKTKNRTVPKGQSNGPAIYPDLVSCTAPIEQILPNLTPTALSRGLGHLVRAQNILTVGNLSSLSETQIQNLPVKSPKVRVVREALRQYASQNKRIIKQRKQEPESTAIKDLSDGCTDKTTGENQGSETSHTPPKLPLPELSEEVLSALSTPSRTLKDARPTSLFEAANSNDFGTDTIKTSDLSKGPSGEETGDKPSATTSDPVPAVVDVKLNCDEDIEDLEDSVYTQESNSPDEEGSQDLALCPIDEDVRSADDGLVDTNDGKIPSTDTSATNMQALADNDNNNNTTPEVLKTLNFALNEIKDETLLTMASEDLFELQEKLTSVSSRVLTAIRSRYGK